jgi:protein O-GlcNAcase/histone acetyltransferase
MDRATLGGAGYLDEIGRLLDPGIDVLWTGPEIVSAEIPVESIERLSRRLRRPPVIWDNLFANDYDFSRLYCGPYSGRSRELRGAVRGILINPNNEYPLNFVPLRTLAAYLSGEGEWKPREAFLEAVAAWLPAFETVTVPLAASDLVLLADCFYLPYAQGPEAEKLLALIHRLLAEPVENWGDAYEQFCQTNERIQTLFERLTELRDRALFAAWSRRAWELKEELLLIAGTLAQKKAGRNIGDGIELDHCLPGTFRGGLLTQLKRVLSINEEGKIIVRRWRR